MRTREEIKEYITELKEKLIKDEISSDEYKREEQRLLDELKDIDRYKLDKSNKEQKQTINKWKHKQSLTHAENNMILLAFATFVILILAEILFYFSFAKSVQSITVKYWHYIFYLIVSVVFIGSAVWHAKHYRHTFTCSTGMMVGMTVGMMSGFMIGAILGATNGMFVGAAFGMFTGMAIGAWCTRTCGVMSVLEGLMGGLMAGLMGAMTTVMLINENLLLFMPLLIGSCALILGGMSYMIYREHMENREEIAKLDRYDMLTYLSAMFVFTIIVTIIIIWGPKSVLVAGL